MREEVERIGQATHQLFHRLAGEARHRPFRCRGRNQSKHNSERPHGFGRRKAGRPFEMLSVEVLHTLWPPLLKRLQQERFHAVRKRPFFDRTDKSIDGGGEPAFFEQCPRCIPLLGSAVGLLADVTAKCLEWVT